MAKKGKDQQKPVAAKHVTTRRLARWQREKRRQRITFLSGVVIIIIVLGIIVGGIVATHSSGWLSKVQTNSGTVTIKKADYADELKLFQAGIYNSSTMTNESPLSVIEDNYLISDKAKGVGISASGTEIENAILTFFGETNKSFSDTDFQQRYQSALSNLSISDQQLRDIMETSLLNTKLQNYYVNQVPTSGQQADVETIFVFNESDANDVTQKWRDGEDFTALSAEYGNYSQRKWVVIDMLDEPLKDVVSTIEIGNVSDPITSGNMSGGTSSSSIYYVLKVMERKEDIISDSTRQSWGTTEYNAWYKQAQADQVERNPKLDLAEVYAWAVKQLS